MKNCRVDVADSNRGKCKVSKKAFTKGQLRLGWRVGESSFVNCLAEHVEDTVIPEILAAVPNFEAEDIKGMSLLTPSDRARYLNMPHGTTTISCVCRVFQREPTLIFLR
jgi:hypothetical protein